MMFNVIKVFRFIEYTAIILAFLSIVGLFFNHFLSMFLAGLTALLSSIGMFIYIIKSNQLSFSKLLLYSLILSSVPMFIIFFKMIK